MIRCKECSFFKQSCQGYNHTNFTVGRGNENSKVMFVFDFPFYSDVGNDRIISDNKTLKYLNTFLNSISLTQEEVYLTSLVKCFRSDKKTNPTVLMRKKCSELYLEKEIVKVKPKVIFLLGKFSINYFIPEFKASFPIKQVVGKKFYNEKYNTTFIPIYDMYYLANFSDKSKQYRLTERAFSLAKTILQEGDNSNRGKITYSKNLSNLNKLGKFVAYDIETTGLDFLTDKILTIALTDGENTFSFDLEDYGGVKTCYKCNGAKQIENQEKNEILCELDSQEKVNKNQLKKAERMPDKVECPVCKGCGKKVLDNEVLKRNHFYTDVLPTCVKLLQSRKTIAHNAMFELKFLRKAGYDASGSLCADTRYLQFLINPEGGNSLGFLTQLYLGIEYKDEIDRSKIVSMNSDDRKYYCCEDVIYTLDIFKILAKEVKIKGAVKSSNVITNLMAPLSELEFKGIYVDKELTLELIQYYTEQKEKKAEEFRKRFKLSYDFNLNSPKQLCKLFFEHLKLPVLITTKKKNPSTNDRAIKKLASKRPALNLLLEYRSLKGIVEKLQGYLDAIREDGRVHSEFSLFSPDSSRLMCKKPNYQNVNRGSRIKEIFKAPDGRSFVYYDMSQIEFRIWACLSKDSTAIEFINKGRDIHSYIASKFYGGDYEYYKNKVDNTAEERRNLTKSINFGSMYGRTPYGIVNQHGGTEEEAERIQKIFFNICREGWKWLNNLDQKVKKEKRLITPFGTPRYFNDLELKKPEEQEKALREARSFIIQSWAVELFFIGMHRVYSEIQKQNLDAFYVHQIHDAGIIECNDSDIDKITKIVEENAKNPYPGLPVPLDIDLKVGKSWAEL